MKQLKFGVVVMVAFRICLTIKPMIIARYSVINEYCTMELMAYLSLSLSLDLDHESIVNFIKNPMMGNIIENRINSKSEGVIFYAIGPIIRYNDI
jgi:hypothetical protein